MSLLGAVKDWKRNLAKEVYKRLEDSIKDGTFEVYIPYDECSNIFTEIIDNILPSIATELKEGDLYVHYEEEADEPDEYDERDSFFTNEEYDYWLHIYVDDDDDDSVEPNGKKLNFDQ